MACVAAPSPCRCPRVRGFPPRVLWVPGLGSRPPHRVIRLQHGSPSLYSNPRFPMNSAIHRYFIPSLNLKSSVPRRQEGRTPGWRRHGAH